MMGGSTVKLDLDSRVKSIHQMFFKKWLGPKNFSYQLELCLKLQKKCLNSKRLDLAEGLAIIVSEGQMRMLKYYEEVKNEIA